MIRRRGARDRLSMLRDDYHRDMATADARAATTAKIAAEVVLVPDDEQCGPFGERARVYNSRHGLQEEGIACSLCEFIRGAAAGSVLVIALIGSDEDKFRR